MCLLFNDVSIKTLKVGVMVINEYEAVLGMRIGRGIRSTRRTPTPVQLCPPQVLHELTCDRIWAAAVKTCKVH
jgi:hypothetical protein